MVLVHRLLNYLSEQSSATQARKKARAKIELPYDKREKLSVGILVSAGGSNMQTLMNWCNDQAYPAKIVGVFSNNPDSYALTRAKDNNIPFYSLSHRDFHDREAYDRVIHNWFMELGTDILCLAGYMRIISPWLAEQWQGRCLNIHPSLLPNYKGLKTHSRVIAAKEPYHGCSVHMVTAGLDDGPLVIQSRLKVRPLETAEELAQRVLLQEHVIYPLALKLLCEGRVKYDPINDRLTIDDEDGHWRFEEGKRVV